MKLNKWPTALFLRVRHQKMSFTLNPTKESIYYARIKSFKIPEGGYISHASTEVIPYTMSEMKIDDIEYITNANFHVNLIPLPNINWPIRLCHGKIKLCENGIFYLGEQIDPFGVYEYVH